MDTDHIRHLVQQALDEFDDRPLGTSARRAYRVARLLGNTQVAHRLHLELRPALAAHDRVTAVAALYPHLSAEEVRARHNEEVERFIDGRVPARLKKLGDDAPSMHFGSIDELATLYEQAEKTVASAEAEGFFDVVKQGIETLADRREIIGRIRSVVFDYLVATEAQLEASDTVSQTLARHRYRVDMVLETVAPELRDQLQAALRAARAEGSEARSQVLTTCRRVIAAVADHLFPARDEPFVDADGKSRPVGQGQYRNRILAAYGSGDTAERSFGSAIADLATRLDRLDELAQKGVHADVSEDEMEFGLAQTYLLVGELMRLRDAR